MARWFDCPYLGGTVELTDEREAHIRLKHEATLDDGGRRVEGALAEPFQVRRSRTDDSARLFIRWYDDLQDGKFVIAVVIDDRSRGGRPGLATAYVTDQPRRGVLEWERA